MRNAFVRLFFITHYTLVHLGVRSVLVRLFFIAQCARPGLRRMFAAIEADFGVFCLVAMIPATAAAAAAKAVAKAAAEGAMQHGPAAAADGVALSAPSANGKGGIERHLDSVFTGAHAVSRVGEQRLQETAKWGGKGAWRSKPKSKIRCSPYARPRPLEISEERMARAAEIAIADLEQQARDRDMAAAGPTPTPTPAPKPEPAPEPDPWTEPSNDSEALVIAGQLTVACPVSRQLLAMACHACSTPAPKPAPTPPTRVHTQDLEDTQGVMDSQDLEDTQGVMDMMDKETLVMAGDTQGVEDLDGMEDTQGV